MTMNDNTPEQPPIDDHQPSADSPHLAHLREKLKRENLRRDRRPSAGIWYWVWLRPNWILCDFKETEYGKITHEQVWVKYVAPEIARHYRLTKHDAERLNPLTKSLPRGRVFRGRKTGFWIFMHAADNPRGNQHFEMLLPSRFNLTKQLLFGGVSFAKDELLEMLPSDQSALKAIIGRLPYRSETRG